MAIEVPRSLVEFILLGPEDDRRQLQDSPILGDVWIEYAKKPDARLELLITPYKQRSAAHIASILADRTDDPESNIAFLQGIVAARLTFEQVLRFVVPLTSWWSEKRIAEAIKGYVEKPSSIEGDVSRVFHGAGDWFVAKKEASVARETQVPSMRDVASHMRYVALAGLLLWAAEQEVKAFAARKRDAQKDQILFRKTAAEVAEILSNLLGDLPSPEPQKQDERDEQEETSLVWLISRNRAATPALTKSVPAVKADAARTLFSVDCSEISWAVIDSGIDASHPAFKDKQGDKCRIKKCFDFTRIRQVISLANFKASAAKKSADVLYSERPPIKVSRAEAAEYLKELADNARKGLPTNWEQVAKLVQIDPDTKPSGNHGTHVAGILGASKAGAKRAAETAAKDGSKPKLNVDDGDWADGMCPDITIYDFRVLAPTLMETEFAIIAVLQYIRYLNERFITIHGANLSLSIAHDVRNFACGSTPVCLECERVVNSGAVVVAAAGNRGYQHFETAEGRYEGYAAFSVTDPGNADGVITVGATHRFWPHTYGVSYFSSRGPTGDGRLKPDLVAPGERIRAPLPGNAWGDLDGTSMAAPHASGAAAMLMARYPEHIGQPRRIKQILCQSATDLGRERSFQGHGMLDVLRAFQSI